MHERIPENGGVSPKFSARLRGGSGFLPSSQLVGGGSLSPGSSSSSDGFERQFLRVLQKVYQTIEKNEIRLGEQDRRDVIRLEWHQLALIIDRLLLLVFIVTTLAITCGILLHAPHSRSWIFGSGNSSDIAVEDMMEMEGTL